MPRQYYVYRHIRKDTNVPFYIGVGKESSSYNRSKDRRRNQLWKNIVDKLNGDFTVHIVLNDLTAEEALEKEKEFITLYGKIIDSTGTLANILDFGTGSSKKSMSDLQKEKLRERMIGNQYSKNYKWSDEKRAAMSISRKGIKNNLGRVWSEETKKKMSDSHIGNTATKGYKRITNGLENKMIKPGEGLPQGFRFGITPNLNKIT